MYMIIDIALCIVNSQLMQSSTIDQHKTALLGLCSSADYTTLTMVAEATGDEGFANISASAEDFNQRLNQALSAMPDIWGKPVTEAINRAGANGIPTRDEVRKDLLRKLRTDHAGERIKRATLKVMMDHCRRTLKLRHVLDDEAFWTQLPPLPTSPTPKDEGAPPASDSDLVVGGVDDNRSVTDTELDALGSPDASAVR